MLSLHHLMTYFSIILTGAESGILELLSPTGLDLGVAGISVPQLQSSKTWYRTYYHRNPHYSGRAVVDLVGSPINEKSPGDGIQDLETSLWESRCGLHSETPVPA